MESMKNLRYQLPKFIAIGGLLALLWWTYFSFIAGPVNKVLVQREQALDVLLKTSAFANCMFLNDSQLDESAYIVVCQSANTERLIVAIDPNGKILSRFRSDILDEEVKVSELKARYPDIQSVQWAFYGNDIIYRLIADTQEVYLNRSDLSVLMKVRLDHE